MNIKQQETGQPVSIEMKEVRGMNLKNLLALIGATVAICTTVLTTRHSIEQKIDKIETKNQYDDAILEIKLRELDARIRAVEVQIKETNARIENYHSRP